VRKRYIKDIGREEKKEKDIVRSRERMKDKGGCSEKERETGIQ